MDMNQCMSFCIEVIWLRGLGMDWQNEHWVVRSHTCMSGTLAITHQSCPDDWLAQFSFTNVHKGGLKHHFHFYAAIKGMW